MLRLASNESAWGTSPFARKAFLREAALLHRYPEAGGPVLRKALAGHFRVQPDQIILGAGSNEILILMALAYLEPGTSAVMSSTTFPIYHRAACTAGARALVIPAKDYGPDLTAMAGAIKADTHLVFLANPNNPTGAVVLDRELRAFLKDLPDSCLLVLDEAYGEFVSRRDFPDGSRLVREGQNVVSVRTFSKMYGLAALRIGYGIVPPFATEPIEKVRQPFNVGSPSVAAALAALGDQAHLRRVRSAVRKEKARLVEGLVRRGLAPIPGEGNFGFVPMKDPAPIARFLLRRGIATRGLPGAGLRITVGRPAGNTRLLSALKGWVHR